MVKLDMKLLIILSLVYCSSLLGIELQRVGDAVIDNTNKIVWQDDMDTISIKLSQKEAKEHESIIDLNNKLNYIQKPFKYNVPSGYWTGEVLWRMIGYYGHYANFTNGSMMFDNKTYKKYVRCVKDDK